MPRVMVIDDEENLRLVLGTLLRNHGYEVDTRSGAEEALDSIEDCAPEFVLADVRMPGMSGLELCEALRQRRSDSTVILMSAYGNVDLAIAAMKAGAYDYVSKPFKKDEVLLVLRKAEEREQLRRENRALRKEMRLGHRLEEMLGKSSEMRSVFRMVEKLAGYTTTVLIQGQSGTGKELVARALHRRSPRAQGPWVAVNCGAIPAALLESELFGHVRGAFTDARSDKKGLFEEADGGTLFLDELGELPLDVQVKLLRVLQESTVRPVGATRDRSVDVRVIAATVRDLEVEVAEKRFREDLFYRLNVVQIRVPPLRERRGDIPLLAEHFIDQNNVRLRTDVQGIDAQALKLLMEYSWPGNVRELQNVIERAVVLTDENRLGVADLPDRLRVVEHPAAEVLASGELSIKKSSRYLEQELIRRALDETKGNRTAAARLLEISHRALLYKIKEYELS
ncbi:MAG: sigma-54 dependent transcriptional regulator [Myxococcota bacterium]